VTVSAPPLTLNELIRLSGIAEEDVLVFRHRPNEPALNRVFDWIVAERPDLFDCYQSNHGRRTESALARARYLASFIRHSPGTALFVGFYEVSSSRRLTVSECMDRPLHRELMSHGMTGIKAVEGRDGVLEFQMPLTEWHANWRGRLIIRWPGLERSWYRWADRNVFEIVAIARESLFTRDMPHWDVLSFEWNELALLPASWCANLRNWRGVYLIIDQVDGKQYVGSAYGAQNILQRWREYARTGHGGNSLLRQRDPSTFRFSILQRTSPDLPDTDVIAVENTWKDRLRTRAPWGLNDN
jgi:hypothetical protein